MFFHIMLEIMPPNRGRREPLVRALLLTNGNLWHMQQHRAQAHIPCHCFLEMLHFSSKAILGLFPAQYNTLHHITPSPVSKAAPFWYGTGDHRSTTGDSSGCPGIFHTRPCSLAEIGGDPAASLTRPRSLCGGEPFLASPFPRLAPVEVEEIYHEVRRCKLWAVTVIRVVVSWFSFVGFMLVHSVSSLSWFMLVWIWFGTRLMEATPYISIHIDIHTSHDQNAGKQSEEPPASSCILDYGRWHWQCEPSPTREENMGSPLSRVCHSMVSQIRICMF